MKRSNLNSQRSPILRAFVLSLAVITATACNKKDDTPPTPPPANKQSTPKAPAKDSANNGKSGNTETAANTPKNSAPSIVPSEAASAGAPKKSEPATQAEKDAALRTTSTSEAQASKEEEIKRKLDESNVVSANRDQLLAAMGTATPLTVMLADYLSTSEENLGDQALRVISTALEDGPTYAPGRIAELHGDLQRLVESGFFVGAVQTRSALLNETLENRIDRLEYRDVIRARQGTAYIALASAAIGVIAGAGGPAVLKAETNRLLQMSNLTAALGKGKEIGLSTKSVVFDALLTKAPKTAQQIADSTPSIKSIGTNLGNLGQRTWGRVVEGSVFAAEIAQANTQPVALVTRKLVKVLGLAEADMDKVDGMALRAVTTTDLRNLQFNETRLPGLTYALTRQNLGFSEMTPGNVNLVFRYTPNLTDKGVSALVTSREMDMKYAEYYIGKVTPKPNAPAEFAVATEDNSVFSSELPADKVDLSSIVDKRTVEAMNQSTEVEPLVDTAALRIRAKQALVDVKTNVIVNGKANINAAGSALATAGKATAGVASKVGSAAKDTLVPDIATFDARWALVTSVGSFTLIKSAMWYQSKIDEKSSADLSSVRDSLIPTAAIPNTGAATEVNEQGK